jgi:phage terminase small subunit
MDKELTPKQKAFADYFIETGNAADAAIRAGYSKKTARSIGSENLTKPNIKNYIDARMAEKDAARVAKQDEILEFLTKVMRGEYTEQIPVGIGEGAQQLEDKDTYLKDRVKAAELLGKRYAMWTDKQQLDGIKPVMFVGEVDD